jgi:hypothetical protein
MLEFLKIQEPKLWRIKWEIKITNFVKYVAKTIFKLLFIINRFVKKSNLTD